MIAITGQIADRDLCPGNSRLNHVFNVAGFHGHGVSP
jgi:hypothetical protein